MKDYVIKGKDGELIVGKRAMLDRLMEHCEDVNNTTETHPLKAGETEEERNEWMHSPEIWPICGKNDKGRKMKTPN